MSLALARKRTMKALSSLLFGDARLCQTADVLMLRCSQTAIVERHLFRPLNSWCKWTAALWAAQAKYPKWSKCTVQVSLIMMFEQADPYSQQGCQTIGQPLFYLTLMSLAFIPQFTDGELRRYSRSVLCHALSCSCLLVIAQIEECNKWTETRNCNTCSTDFTPAATGCASVPGSEEMAAKVDGTDRKSWHLPLPELSATSVPEAYSPGLISSPCQKPFPAW